MQLEAILLGVGGATRGPFEILTYEIIKCIPPSKFTSLPPEVIVDILKELNCQDVLRIQQVRNFTPPPLFLFT